ncbi:MAG: tetratricopeptide repeat protein [Bacillota bacterium]|nr:tetratricopeptide repeat protein [Bacillota bacterium]
MGKKQALKPMKQTGKRRRQARGQIIGFLLAGVMVLSLAAYYFGAAGPARSPAPAGRAGDLAAGDRYVEEGNRAYDSGDFAAAIRYYEQALPWRGRDPGVLTDLGTAYFYRTPSDPARAIAYYDRALEVSPGFPNALFNKGIVLLQGQNDPAGAIAAWEQLLAVLPQDDPAAPKVKTFIANARTLLSSETASPPAPSAPRPPSAPPPAPFASSGTGSRLSSGFGR